MEKVKDPEIDYCKLPKYYYFTDFSPDSFVKTVQYSTCRIKIVEARLGLPKASQIKVCHGITKICELCDSQSEVAAVGL